MNIIVFGASGGVGQEVVKQALEQGHTVTAFVRDRSRLSVPQQSNLKITEGDGLNQQAVAQAIHGHDCVICCVGSRGGGKTTLMSDITRNIISGMEQAQVERIAYVASAGIHRELSGIAGRFVEFLLRNPLADHRRSYELLKNSSLKWTVARPMQLTNGDKKAAYRETDTGIAHGGTKISRADTAHFLLKAVAADAYIHQSIGLAY